MLECTQAGSRDAETPEYSAMQHRKHQKNDINHFVEHGTNAVYSWAHLWCEQAWCDVQ